MKNKNNLLYRRRLLCNTISNRRTFNSDDEKWCDVWKRVYCHVTLLFYEKVSDKSVVCCGWRNIIIKKLWSIVCSLFYCHSVPCNVFSHPVAYYQRRRRRRPWWWLHLHQEVLQRMETWFCIYSLFSRYLIAILCLCTGHLSTTDMRTRNGKEGCQKCISIVVTKDKSGSKIERLEKLWYSFVRVVFVGGKI